MSRRVRSDRYDNALNTYDIVSQQGYPVHSYEDVKQPIRVSGMPGVATGWALIFMLFIPVTLWYMLQNNVMGAMDKVVELLSSFMEVDESMKELIPLVPFILSLITFLVCLCHYAHERHSVSYRISSSMLVQIKNRKYGSMKMYDQACRLILKPGMSVSVHKTFKGRVFRYADVIIHLAVGADNSEVVLHNVKNYNKVAKMLRGIIHDSCLTSTRSMIFKV